MKEVESLPQEQKIKIINDGQTVDEEFVNSWEILDYCDQYNGKLRSAELLLKEDGSVQMIRRAETPKDYFATFDFCDKLDKLNLN